MFDENKFEPTTNLPACGMGGYFSKEALEKLSKIDNTKDTKSSSI